jgi:precorrin-3B synthase
VLAYLGVGLPFGRTSAAGLTNLAACALETGATEMRLTPWRAILIPLPSAEDAQALAARLAGASLILDPADPRLRLAACSGAPSCPHGTTDTRADAAYLAPIVEHRSGIALHVSGCAKGCAHPRAAPVTLVGSRGRYDLVIGGKPSDSPSLTGLTLDAAAGHLRQMADRHAQGGTA